MTSDPYRWMEEDTAALRAWVQAQHEHTMAQLSSLPAREGIRRRLEELRPRGAARGAVTKAGERYFFLQRSQNEELASLYCHDEPHNSIRLLLDPSELSSDGTIALADIHPSPDGSLIAYRLTSSGSSRMSLHVMDVNSKKVLDVIPGDVNPVAHAWHTKNRVAWLPDNSGFYYTRCPRAMSGEEARFNHKLYFHRLGYDWREDELVFSESLKREQTPYPLVSWDGRNLVVLVQDVSGDSPYSELYLLDREEPKRGFVPIVRGIEAFISAAAVHRNRLYIQTNHEAPLGKLMAIDLADVSRGEFTTVIREFYPLRAWITVGNYLFVERLEDVSSRLCMYDLAGKFIEDVEMPPDDLCSINGLSAQPESNELLISFSSFLIPKVVYCVDLETWEWTPYHENIVQFNSWLFDVDQVWFESRDGTRVPMFLLYKGMTKRNENNPVVIHGYGGFGVSLLPAFMPQVIPFLERGGIYVILNARGGGEFGEKWHWAGMRENKQNTFDDFIAAAEWLIAEGYTQPSRLGCFGWSNGGLSVNAVAVQRPDLWKAVVAGAAVTDMARFHTAHTGRHWIADYGSPEDPRELEFLMQYSPYHTLPQKIEAPAILTIAPDNDDRVASWHSYKMHAAWLAANVSNNPILLRREERAGHRGSPAASRTIDRYTDIWTFFFWQLGVD